MDYILILIMSHGLATAEFYTRPACEDAGKAYLETSGPWRNARYVCVPKAQNRPQHEQHYRPKPL